MSPIKRRIKNWCFAARVSVKHYVRLFEHNSSNTAYQLWPIKFVIRGLSCSSFTTVTADGAHLKTFGSAKNMP